MGANILSTTPTTALVVSLGIVLFCYLSRRREAVAVNDPYGLFHLTLNRLPGEDASKPPKTEWLNMGYWKNTTVFPEAAQALAKKLIVSANLKKNGRVLDVGHGTGESLLLLLSGEGIERPSSLTGITSILEHTQRSLRRVKALQDAMPETRSTEVKLFHGDAVYRESKDTDAHEHPFSEVTQPYDSILVLDCAYHFNTRHRFLEQALAHLAPGGTIALADICFASSSLQGFHTQLLVKVLRLMPQANVISDTQYIAQMEGLGYQDVALENVTADVFPGFVRFLKSRGVGWYIFGCIMGWYARAGAQFVIVSGRKQE